MYLDKGKYLVPSFIEVASSQIQLCAQRKGIAEKDKIYIYI